MKTLILMRHAKSSWADEQLDDYERPLNARGQRDAPRMAEWLSENQLLPDAIRCSSALRARTTIEILRDTVDYQGDLQWLDELYLAAPGTYLEVAGQMSEDCRSLMMVGHNPGLEMLIETLTGESEVMPTGAVAIVQLPIEQWCELTPETAGELMQLTRPKQLL